MMRCTLFHLLSFLLVPLLVLSAARGQGAERKKIAFTMRFVVTPKPTPRDRASNAILTTLLPRSLERRQKITKIEYSHPPAKEFDEKGNRYARFVFDNLRTPLTLRVHVEAELSRYDFETAAELREKGKLVPGPIPRDFVDAEKYLEIDALSVREAARVVGGKNQADTVHKSLAFVKRTLRYSGYNAKDLGAVEALKRKHGDCTEFADLLVALCRARGLPARVCEGYLVDSVRKGDTPAHNWAEVFLKEYGWVPFDPLHMAQGAASADRLKNHYIYFSQRRNDATLGNFHFYMLSTAGAPADVQDTFVISATQPR